MQRILIHGNLPNKGPFSSYLNIIFDNLHNKEILTHSTLAMTA